MLHEQQEGLENCGSLRVCFFNGTAITAMPQGMASLAKLERVMIPAACSSPAEAMVKDTCERNGAWLKKL